MAALDLNRWVLYSVPSFQLPIYLQQKLIIVAHFGSDYMRGESYFSSTHTPNMQVVNFLDPRGPHRYFSTAWWSIPL